MPYNCILIGYGEIGSAINEVFGEVHNISIKDLDFAENMREDNTYDLMLVAIPYSENFVEAIKKYQEEFKVKSTIIFSTVAIGTTSQIPNAVHCPVEGRHPNLIDYIKKWNFIMGGYNEIAWLFFREAGKVIPFVSVPETMEIAKLQSTSLYGVNLEFARYINEVCKANGVSYKDINKYNQNYNDLYKESNMSQFSRYILKPPEGNTGGHCVVPNAKILDKQYPSIFLKEIYRDKEGNDV